MILDVSKYLVTAGLIGGLLTEKITAFAGIIVFVIAIGISMVGFYVIPPKKEDT